MLHSLRFVRMYRTRPLRAPVFVLYESRTNNVDDAAPIAWTITGSHQWLHRDLADVRRHIARDDYVYVRDFFVPYAV